MSDLYLVLRHRLDHVADWFPIETEVLREARRRLKLSYETVAREIPVSSKTYERYEKRGRVPRDILPRLAQILELEIETPAREPLRVTEPTAEAFAEIIERLDRIEKLLRRRLPSERNR